jgi:hypothetical protein
MINDAGESRIRGASFSNFYTSGIAIRRRCMTDGWTAAQRYLLLACSSGVCTFARFCQALRAQIVNYCLSIAAGIYGRNSRACVRQRQHITLWYVASQCDQFRQCVQSCSGRHPSITCSSPRIASITGLQSFTIVCLNRRALGYHSIVVPLEP